MKLLIDVGNSRIKMGVYYGDVLTELPPISCSMDTFGQQLSEQFERQVMPEAVLVSNVAGPVPANIIRDQVAALWGKETIFASTAQEWQGLVNGYTDTRQLGVDRWLALMAAWDRYRSFFCVVSCGTAMTIDAVTASGQHLGGLIIPGLELMQSALNTSTQGINTRIGREAVLALGTSTYTCIANGAAYTSAALIDRVIRDLQDEYQQMPHLLLTGGNAVLINKTLANAAEIVPALVLKGLAVLAGNCK